MPELSWLGDKDAKRMPYRLLRPAAQMPYLSEPLP